MALTFELVSPERKLASVEAEAVTIPGMEGDLTAMAGHAPFLTTLRPGHVVVRSGSSETRYFVTGGFAEISQDVVSVLAEGAVEAESADAAFLDERIAEAQKALDEAPDHRRRAAQQRVHDFTALRARI
jgi:F-type H+-transporting ATPase subunit epsilon